MLAAGCFSLGSSEPPAGFWKLLFSPQTAQSGCSLTLAVGCLAATPLTPVQPCIWIPVQLLIGATSGARRQSRDIAATSS